MIARLSRRLRPASDSGLTLPELLVTMALTAIIGAMVVTFVAGYSRTLTRESARNDSTNVAAVGMNELTRIIRAGVTVKNDHVPGGREPMIRFAGAERLEMHAGVDTDAINPRPLLVNFRLDGSRVLTETRTTARPGGSSEAEWVFTGSGTRTSTRAIARKVVPRAAGEPPLFRYYDADGDELLPGAGSSLSSDDRGRVASVEIYLTVQADDTARAEPVTLTNRVGLRNVG